jgi:hypothetical protein
MLADPDGDGWGPYVLRDYRGLTVELVPFLAQGATGMLRAASHLRVEIAANGIDSRNTIERASPPSKFVGEFADIYRDHFLNWELGRYTPVIESGRMLVVTYDAFHDAMLPFVEWKNQMGIPTTLVDVSTIGNTAAQIDSYIDNVYNTEERSLHSGGRARVAPTRRGPFDPTYAKSSETTYPEIFVVVSPRERLTVQTGRPFGRLRAPAAGAGIGRGRDRFRSGTGDEEYNAGE